MEKEDSQKKMRQASLFDTMLKKRNPNVSLKDKSIDSTKEIETREDEKSINISDKKTDSKCKTTEIDQEENKENYVKLEREFFKDEVVSLSRKLLGKVIRRNFNGQVLRCRIVETEAYKAPEDKGCHAYNNKRTDRTEAFWCDAGCWYVYTIYMKTNLCLNVVAADKNIPEAVLIRAGEPLEGMGQMQIFRNKVGRNKPADIIALTNGPGKLGQALNIGLDYSKRDMCEENIDAFIEDDRSYTLSDDNVVISKRINIDYAGEYKDKPWRFYIKNNKYVSVK